MSQYKQKVSLGRNVSAFGVAYLSGAPGSYLAFDAKPLTTVLADVSGSTPQSFTAKVDRAYNASAFAVIASNRSSTLFTCNTAVATQSLTANGFNTVTGETRRLASLGYL